MPEMDDLRDPELCRIAREHGLTEGRMIAMSKSGYRERHPDRYPVFNAYVADEQGRPLWHGDLDLTLDEAALVAVARDRGIRLLVLREHELPSVMGSPHATEAAAIVIDPDGTVRLGTSAVVPIIRGPDGRLRRAPRDDRPPLDFGALPSHPDCTHREITAYSVKATGEPVPFWSCAACGRRFAPTQPER
jgi:hypothetical protein